MDQLGEVVRRYLSQAKRDALVKARVMLDEMKKDGYRKDQAEELLLAHGISEEVIQAALNEVDFE
jgi:hypothetical protein